MNLTVWVLLGELLFISLTGLIFLVIAKWRKRKRLIAELAALLSRVNRSEPDRQLRFQARLMDNFGLDEDEAESLSIEIMRAERMLFKTFTEIQLGADIRKIGAFDNSVYGLLDKYWELLAIGSVRESPDAVQIGSPDFESNVADFSEEMDSEAIPDHFEETASEEGLDQSNPADDFTEPLASPDFESDVAVFSEEMDSEAIPDHFEDTGSEEGLDQSNPADDFAEPSWDDAFAEASQHHASDEMVDEILNDTGAKAIRSD